MSVVRKINACPRCGSTDFHEIGRVEAGDFGPADPPRDLAIYACEECGLEFDSEDETPRPVAG